MIFIALFHIFPTLNFSNYHNCIHRFSVCVMQLVQKAFNGSVCTYIVVDFFSLVALTSDDVGKHVIAFYIGTQCTHAAAGCRASGPPHLPLCSKEFRSTSLSSRACHPKIAVLDLSFNSYRLREVRYSYLDLTHGFV